MDTSNPKSKDYDPDQGVDWAGVLADWAASEDPPAYDAYIHDSDTEKILKEVTRHDDGNSVLYLKGWRLRLMSLR